MTARWPVRAWMAAAAALTAWPAAAQTPVALEDVLARMAEAGGRLTTLEARVDRDTVNALVDDHSLDSGRVYFEAGAGNSRIRVEITEPDYARQSVLVADGRIDVYNPRTRQVSRGTLEGPTDMAQFLVVGFGPGNAALETNFEITLVGDESLDGVPTTVLDLVPRSDQVRGNVSKIRLWVDHDRWAPVRQRLEQPSLNYQVVDYSDIEINGGLGGDVFDLGLPDDVEVLRLN